MQIIKTKFFSVAIPDSVATRIKTAVDTISALHILAMPLGAE